MNPLERLIQTDLNLLIDRLAVVTREGLLADCAERRPDLVEQLAEAESRLTAARRDLIQSYAFWRDALEAWGDVWALLELAAGPPACGERRAA
ncbi:MAG TPA: hypothetical protein VEL75_20445 [Candidatus Methylomirabilis sp.]|nr:hypothetical protein [Candidatus Methylomirabilis sp.]